MKYNDEHKNEIRRGLIVADSKNQCLDMSYYLGVRFWYGSNYLAINQGDNNTKE